MRTKILLTAIIFLSTLTVTGVATAAPEAGMPALDAESVGRTPPRLSFLDGQVSFWRPGADDWTQAQINTALAPGDQLFIQGHGNLELQVGAQAFVRGGPNAQFGLETQEPDFLRFKVTGGLVSFDLRTLGPGRTVEVDTPHGAFTIEDEGYYRLDVDDSQSEFAAHRNGRATAVAAGGEGVAVESGEAVFMQSPSGQAISVASAPALDAWDNWNYARTDSLLAARSLQYVPDQAYGASDLDRYGSWRVLPTYGPVWVPSGVAADWAPYSTGSWMYDPYYGWTWVDTAPWGWAPYHYGRWVHVNSYWCWAPGPIVARPYYAPALVAFFGGPAVSVGISIGGPGVGWVALGWGEPLVPWWGRPGFIHRPWWAGWGGPRCINSRVIHRRTIVTVHDIHTYSNRRVRHALVVVDKDRFGHGRIRRGHHRRADYNKWRPTHQAPGIRPSARSYAPSLHRGRRPPERSLKRSVVTINPHSRPRHGTVKRPAPVHRSTVRTFPENRRPSPNGGAEARFKPRRFAPAPAKNRPMRETRPRMDRKKVVRQPNKAPAHVRPKTRSLHPSPSRIDPVPENHRGRAIAPKSGERVSPIRRPETRAPAARFHRSTESMGSRRFKDAQPTRPTARPANNGGRRFRSRTPANPEPAFQAPRRQLPRAGSGRSTRIAPSQSQAQPEVSRPVNRNFRGNGRNPDAGAWRQRHGGAGRPEMNRGAGFQSRHRLQRPSRD